ncbi:hypothetical protein PGTUg99_010660 [Puccinia graminis f. sp. tritici]|uniref:Uncharacterized protein n=1 Tax=Puccinia graminis f. sp. tritici TaxID=56615 RepID=A0A5B0NV43_PUCGR|nr:hypothetical protein PGTUg99_010660 [Puccinia graminis f. sp. tritici]
MWKAGKSALIKFMKLSTMLKDSCYTTTLATEGCGLSWLDNILSTFRDNLFTMYSEMLILRGWLPGFVKPVNVGSFEHMVPITSGHVMVMIS